MDKNLLPLTGKTLLAIIFSIFVISAICLASKFNAFHDLWKVTAFWQTELSNYEVGVFLDGILVTAIIFNLFIYLSIKDKIHLYYCMYVLCVLIFFLKEKECGFKSVYPSVPYLQDKMELFMTALAITFIIEITQLFVGQRERKGLLFHTAQALKFAGYGIAPIVLSFLFFHPAIWMATGVFYIVTIVSLLAVFTVAASSVQCGVQGNKLAWFFLIAISPLLLGIINYQLNALGITNINLMHPNRFVISTTSGIIMLALVLIYRYNSSFLLIKRQLLENLKFQQHMMIAEGEDRAKLARDLHDDLGGTLAAVKLNVTSFEHDFGAVDGKHGNFYLNTVTLLNKAGDDLRNISRNLIPGDFAKKGLTHILKEKVDHINCNEPVQFTFISNNNEITFNLAFELAIYRIFIELINNILKHANASVATLQYIIDKDKNLIGIVAEDDGKGLNGGKHNNSVVLKNIKEKTRRFNGTFIIDTSPHGSTIMIELPFNYTNFNHGI